jgi:hypothetical protein
LENTYVERKLACCGAGACTVGSWRTVWGALAMLMAVS